MTISIETKLKAVYTYGMNRSLRKTAKSSNISKSTLQRWIHSCKTNNFSKQRTHLKKFYKIHNHIILTVCDSLKRQPFLTLKNLQILVKKAHGVSLSHETIRRIIRFSNITRKRANPRIMKSQTYWSHLQEKRRIFLETYVPISIESIVSIDESAICSNLFPTYGYNERGKKLHVPTRSMRTQKSSILMAISSQKVEHVSILKENVNSASFLNFIRELVLKFESTQKRVFLMDNVSFHKSQTIEKEITSHGHTILFTPPYSPDTNPIENVFSLIKRKIRKDHGKPFSLVVWCLQHVQINSTSLIHMFERSKKVHVTDVAQELYKWLPK